jgi:hypothetical protein
MKMGLSQFWDDFTGKSAVKSAYADSTATLGAAKAAGSQKYATAEGEFDPWIKSGGEANDLYGNALGLHGPQGAQSAWDAYSSNPGFLAAEELGVKNLNRKYNAGGLNLSGADIQGSQIAGLNYYDTYLNKLKDQAGVGFNASSALARKRTKPTLAPASRRTKRPIASAMATRLRPTRPSTTCSRWAAWPSMGSTPSGPPRNLLESPPTFSAALGGLTERAGSRSSFHRSRRSMKAPGDVLHQGRAIAALMKGRETTRGALSV